MIILDYVMENIFINLKMSWITYSGGRYHFLYYGVREKSVGCRKKTLNFIRVCSKKKPSKNKCRAGPIHKQVIWAFLFQSCL